MLSAPRFSGILLYTNACTLQQFVIILFFMKQYVIDELRPGDYKSLKTYFDDQYETAALDGIYWIPLEIDILSEIQREHKACQPHCVALNLNYNRIACEFLVRTQNRVRCDCINYATENQRNWLIEWIDNIFKQLEIKV